MFEKVKTITKEAYEASLRKLIGNTKGMRENVEPAVKEFKQESMPYSETALEMLIASGYVDDRYRSTTPKEERGVLDQIHEVFFSNEPGVERTMPDGAKVVWEGLCECYLPAPKDSGAS